MRLSDEALIDIVASLRGARLGPPRRFGLSPVAVNPPPKAALAARARVRPVGNAQRRAWSVAVRSVTASGVVFVDGNCWMDGEQLILQFPNDPAIPAVLCTITYWQPIASDLFVVSANFVRPLRAAPHRSSPDDQRRRHATGL